MTFHAGHDHLSDFNIQTICKQLGEREAQEE
jgi:hypothetical protein